MANQTKKELLQAAYRATMKALGYDPDKNYGSTPPPVRISYPAEGQPDWTADDDVVFIAFEDVPGDDTTQPVHEEWETKGDKLRKTHYSNRVVRFTWTAYGPHAYDNMIQLRHTLLDGADALRKAGLYIIPSPETPRYVPELYGGLWWKRADLAFSFNNMLVWDETVTPIETVPVDVHDNPGTSEHTIETTAQVGPYGIIIIED